LIALSEAGALSCRWLPVQAQGRKIVSLIVEPGRGPVPSSTGWRLGRFDPRHYQRITGLNTDFRKVQDGLRMTLSMTPAEVDQMIHLLEQERQAGAARSGLSLQDSAVLTCYVPSVLDDGHLHFLDGAGGGYAAAASAMRD
jgi:hypothetical protein